MKVLVFEKITDSLIDNGVINLEDKDIYVYGFKQGILMLLNVAVIMIIGSVLGMVWQSIIFILVYVLMRTYAGGYHATTQLRCFLISIIIVTSTFLGMKYITWTSFICWLLIIVSIITIRLLSPVEDVNKPLTKTENTNYQNKAVVILNGVVGIAFVVWFMGQSKVLACISSTLFVVSMMLLVGEIKNRIKRCN